MNGLARVERPWQRYTVIGAGKTGLDALLYLLAQVCFCICVYVCVCVCHCHCTQGLLFKSRCNVCQCQCLNVQGVAPSKIQWVCSNDVWYLNRAAIVNDGGMHVRKLPTKLSSNILNVICTNTEQKYKKITKKKLAKI